jgi:NADH:ubiquinone reductase (H+-translocating)
VARSRVVVVGAGFAGLWTARRLAGKEVDVTLLDRHNFHTFLPLLYQVASADLGPAEIAYPVRSIFRGATNIDFHMAEVTDLDLEARQVVTDIGRFPYDHLVLALGSVSHFFGVEGAEEHAFPLKTMEDAVPLRHRILSSFEKAVCERDPEQRRRLLTFAIVGGGPTGVEFSGALAELIRGPLGRDYPMIDPDEVRVVLIEAMDRLLVGMPGKLSRYAKAQLERRNVEVLLDSAARSITPHAIELADGTELASETVIWTAGVRGVPGPEAWGLPVGRGGRIPVSDTLQVAEHPEVRVAGDLALLEVDGQPLPGVAPVALQQGTLAADNILRELKGEAPRPFRFRDPGMLAIIGRNNAVAWVRERAFTGFFAWILWLVVHIAKLIGFRNRVLVLTNWAWNYLSRGRAPRLILPPDAEAPLRREPFEPAL